MTPAYRVVWAFVLEPIDANRTRLLARASGDYDRRAVWLLLQLAWRPMHFAMEREQLLNLRRGAKAPGRDLRGGEGRYLMRARVKNASSRVRVAALLLIVGLLAGPVGTHVYWALGGTWGLHQSTSTGIRVVAVVVIVLLVAAVLVVLARVGLWQQAFVSDRVIRFFAWALAGVFLVETVAAFTWSRGDPEWWLYGPVSLVLALLALIVAGSGGAWPRVRGPHRTLPSR